jgi:hypothetical protein
MNSQFTFSRKLLLACILGTLCLPTAMFAQAASAAQHPEFLHALSDLRMARAYLDKLSPNDTIDNDSAQAIKQIDEAISDLKKASIDDGKNLSDHPPVDATLPKSGRFHKAKELLDKAHDDVKQPESDPAARALQARIMRHLDVAHNFVEQAIAAAGKH